MNTAFDVLVIVLSCLLGIFLIISIVVVALIWKLVSSLRKVIAKGEHLVDTAGELSETLRRNAGAVGMVKMIMKFLSTINKMRD